MGEGRLRIDVSGREELGNVIDALSQEEAELPAAFRRALHEVADDIAQQARDRVLEEPAYGIKHTGLRVKLAAGTQVEDTSDGVAITVEPEGEDERLPADMDEGGWSHPVYGHRNNWVRQGGYFSWFTDVVDDEENEQRLEDALGDQIQDAIRRIASA